MEKSKGSTYSSQTLPILFPPGPVGASGSSLSSPVSSMASLNNLMPKTEYAGADEDKRWEGYRHPMPPTAVGRLGSAYDNASS